MRSRNLLGAFVREIDRQSRASARANNRAYAQAERDHARSLRDHARSLRELERQNIRDEKETKRRYVEDRMAEVEDQNKEISEAVEQIENILVEGLSSSPAINFENLKVQPEQCPLALGNLEQPIKKPSLVTPCLLYTSDAADE